MKRGILLLVICILFLLPLVAADGAVVPMTGKTALRISIEYYNPTPVTPGDYVDLYIAVQSQGDDPSRGLSELDELKNVELKLLNSYPFTVSGENIKEIGTIIEGGKAVVKFKVRVDDNAVSGENDLNFEIKANHLSNFIEVPPIQLNVLASDASLVIDSAITNPSIVTPGTPADLMLTLKNDARTLLKEIRVQLDYSSTTLDLAPIFTGSEKGISQLGIGDTADITFSLIPFSDADSGVYKLPVTISFIDALGKNYTTNDMIGIMVGGNIILDVDLADFDSFWKGKKGNVVVSVVNNGPSESMHTTLELKDGEGYTVLSNKKDYLGNLESDDFETSEYEIYIDKKDVDLDLDLTYTDAFNNVYTDNVIIELPVYNNAQISKYGLNGTGGKTVMALMYLFVILFLFYGFRTWRKTKDMEAAVVGGIKEVLFLVLRVVMWFRWRNLKKIPSRIKAAMKRV